jgi:predicted nucleotidyltransferase
MVYLQLEKTDFEVLSFLIGNLGKEYSIRDISRELVRSYVKIHNSVKRLSKKKIIKENIKGKSHYCSLDYEKNIDVVCFIQAQLAKEFLEKNQKISLIISDIISSIKFSDYTLVLFGSYAKGNADRHSDIDIVIMTSAEDKEKAERAVNSIRKLSPLEVHSLEFTYSEFIQMLSSKENNVGKEIVKSNIIFKGCEQFYDCISLSK